MSTRKHNNEYDVLTATKKACAKTEVSAQATTNLFKTYYLISLEGAPYLLGVPTCQTLLR